MVSWFLELILWLLKEQSFDSSKTNISCFKYSLLCFNVQCLTLNEDRYCAPRLRQGMPAGSVSSGPNRVGLKSCNLPEGPGGHDRPHRSNLRRNRKYRASAPAHALGGGWDTAGGCPVGGPDWSLVAGGASFGSMSSGLTAAAWVASSAISAAVNTTWGPGRPLSRY